MTIPQTLIDHLTAIHSLRLRGFSDLPYRPSTHPGGTWSLKEGVVCLQNQEADADALSAALRALIPWRKGPFRINDLQIDAEWDCRIKWDHISAKLPDLKGKTVLDLGCGNGYYLFRAKAAGAKIVIGIDPALFYYRQYQCLCASLAEKSLQGIHFYLAGWQDLGGVPPEIDIIFCLGILYHHTDPIELLRILKSLLNKGGSLFVESQGIDDQRSIAYVPKGKYAGAKGMWFLPSPSCQENWLFRSGFTQVETFEIHLLSEEEQRKTPWSPHASLKENLDIKRKKTVEGHPAPIRIYTLAQP